MFEGISGVDREASGSEDRQPEPGAIRQEIRHGGAVDRAQHACKRGPRNAKRPRNIWSSPAHYEDADTDDRKRKQDADGNEISQYVHRKYTRYQSKDHATDSDRHARTLKPPNSPCTHRSQTSSTP